MEMIGSRSITLAALISLDIERKIYITTTAFQVCFLLLLWLEYTYWRKICECQVVMVNGTDGAAELIALL